MTDTLRTDTPGSITGVITGEIFTEYDEVITRDDLTTGDLQFTVMTGDGREIPASYRAVVMETVFPILREGESITLYGSQEREGAIFDVESYAHTPGV